MRSGGLLAPRSARGVRAVLVLAWVLAVVLAASIAWRAVAVIGGDRTGDRVLSQEDVSSDLARLEQPGPVEEPGTATAGPSEAATDPGVAPTTPAADPSPAAPEAVEVARVWPVTGGEVAARCLGPAISLDSARPADGWAVEVDLEDGAEAGREIRVEFRSDEAETRVRATCVDGVPTAVVEDRGAGDD